MKHERRTLYLAKHYQQTREPIKIEWNRDAGAVLTLVTLGCFIMTAAVLLHLFVEL